MSKWFELQNAVMSCGGDLASMHPVALKALSYFAHNLIPAGEWIRWFGMVNSDNLALGECVLRSLPGISI